MTKAAIYARVSTKDRGQDVENQLIQLRQYAAGKSWEVVEYIDHESGKSADRSAFKKVFADAGRHKFSVVLVWALDRFTREGVFETFAHIRKLTDCGVKFESFTEEHFRTTGAAGDLLMAVSAWIAQQERNRISERTRAGLARARAAGKIGGRHYRVFPREEAVCLRSAGLSWRAIAKELRVPFTTVRDAVISVRQTSAAQMSGTP